MFDPGQGLPLFSGPELIEMIDAATYVAVNDYEGSLLAERTGLALEAIARRVDALIVTLGADGSRIHADGRALELPAVTPPRSSIRPAAATPTARACCTASRSGWDWERTGRLAATLGSLKIASRGGQNHAVDRDAVAKLYHEQFAAYLW